ncbi:S8 family serine peptidase, partial [bacterium]|nr:S8 family serine peptidase [bacterium]
PATNLAAASALPDVISVDDDSYAYPCLDQSALDVGAASARQRSEVSGKGVLVAIIDSGIDWRHEDFRTAEGKTRIKYILDLSLAGTYYGGRIITEEEINQALASNGDTGHHDYAGHGTHVAGIAAGDGSSGGHYGLYCGMAPEADLVIVKATRQTAVSSFKSSDQIIALSFIDSVAAVLNQPYVANLSFGGHAGAHDGTSPVERYIDQLVGVNKPGKVIVTVAGNDAENAIHAFATAGGSGSRMEVNIPPYAAKPGSDNDRVQIDGWYSGTKKITLTVVSPNGLTYGPVPAGQYIDKSGADGSVYVWNGYYAENNGYVVGVNPFNGDREFYVDISDAGGMAPKPGIWTIRLTGDAADVHAWIAHTSFDAVFAAGNVNTHKVAIPGTSKNALCVAAYPTKETWDDADGHHLTIDSRGTIKIGAIASFSSPGPARYSSPTKPDLAAPGQIIASALSQFAGLDSPSSIFTSGNADYPRAFLLSDGRHAMSSGTSMAAPHVTGAVALILQKHPTATATQVRTMLAASARTAANQDALRWGAGKLDVVALLQVDPGEEIAPTFSLAPAFPNPFHQITCFTFQLPIDHSGGTRTTVTIHNGLGQKVKSLLEEKRSAGSYSVYWDGRDDLGYRLASGVYLVVFKYGDKRRVMKVTLLN